MPAISVRLVRLALGCLDAGLSYIQAELGLMMDICTSVVRFLYIRIDRAIVGQAVVVSSHKDQGFMVCTATRIFGIRLAELNVGEREELTISLRGCGLAREEDQKETRI